MIGQIFRIKLIAAACLKKGTAGNFAQRISQAFKGATKTVTIEEIEAMLAYLKTEYQKTEKHLIAMKNNNQAK